MNFFPEFFVYLYVIFFCVYLDFFQFALYSTCRWWTLPQGILFIALVWPVRHLLELPAADARRA